MAFDFSQQEWQRFKQTENANEMARRPLHVGRPDSPYERALARSWMAKGAFTLNGRPQDNIRVYLESLDPVLLHHITGGKREK